MALSHSFTHTFQLLAYLSLVIVFLSITLPKFWSNLDDPYKCKALMNEGQWLDTPLSNGSRSPFKEWQPRGCMLRQYKSDEVAQCTAGKSIVFLGDSTARQIFWATARKLNATSAWVLEQKAHKHKDQRVSFGGIHLEFVWDPFLNSSRLHSEVEKYGKDGDDASRPAITFIGAGAWFSRWFDEQASILNFQAAVRSVTAKIDPVTLATKMHDISNRQGIGDQIFFGPPHPPRYERLSGEAKQTILPGKIEKMHSYLAAYNISQSVLWSYLAMTEDQTDARDYDGLHVVESAADAKAEVLLNIRCNAVLDQINGYPFNRTCCSNYTPLSWVQIAIFATAFILSLLVLQSIVQNEPNATRDALFIFLVTLCFCYSVDRTQLFDKVKNHFVLTEFLILCAVVLVPGLLSIRHSAGDAQFENHVDQPFLSRDQMNEWKGWMQCTILIYNWTGASHILPIYQIFRLLVASYLFQTGFEYTDYFLRKNDFSFQYVAAVLMKLNLLSCALPYMMGTGYLFYYISPLVTFWFLVVYTTMRVYASRNDSTSFVAAKIAISAVLVNLALVTPVCNVAFWVLEHVFFITLNIHEWKAHISLDRYIVFTGMLVGLLFKRYTVAVSNNALPASFRFLRIAAIVVSVFAIPVTFMIFQTTETNVTYNALHAYSSPLPVLIFVVLRNATSTLRSYHSALFAWLGTFTLETFVLQFHIWLAADRTGILSLGVLRGDGSLLEDRWRILAIITPLFFWLSWKMAGITGTLTQFIIYQEKMDSVQHRAEFLEAGEVEGMKSSGKQVDTASAFTDAASWVWPTDSRFRVAVLLGVMWSLNITW